MITQLNGVSLETNLGYATDDSSSGNCPTVDLTDKDEHINKVKVYSGPLQNSDLTDWTDRDFIRGIIFYTNQGSAFKCISSVASTTVYEFDFSIDETIFGDDILVLLTGIWGQSGAVIDGLKFQIKTVPIYKTDRYGGGGPSWNENAYLGEDIRSITWLAQDTYWDSIVISDFGGRYSDPLGTIDVGTSCGNINSMADEETIEEVLVLHGTCSGCLQGAGNYIRGLYLISNFGTTFKCVADTRAANIDSFDAGALMLYNGYTEWVGISGGSGGILDSVEFQWRVYPSMFQQIRTHPFTYWLNDYEENFSFDVHNLNSIFCGWTSYHKNGPEEDRILKIRTCTPSEYNNIILTQDYGSATAYDATWELECPYDYSFISGINSNFNAVTEDRNYQIKCSHFTGSTDGFSKCFWTGYQNDYDAFLNYYAPRGYGINGIGSVHDNAKEDRLYKFRVCKINVDYIYDDEKYATVNTKNSEITYNSTEFLVDGDPNVYQHWFEDWSNENGVLTSMSSESTSTSGYRSFKFRIAYLADGYESTIESNSWEQDINYECNNKNEFIFLVSTLWYQNANYRSWKLGCGKPLYAIEQDCFYGDYVGTVNSDWSFDCPADYGISGMFSKYDSVSGDRQYRFKCCRIKLSDFEDWTYRPTPFPTTKPTTSPTRKPTSNPTIPPTERPTNNPTERPTGRPSVDPTKGPTTNPTERPTNNPSHIPTVNPTIQPTPSQSPTLSPTRLNLFDNYGTIITPFYGSWNVDPSDSIYDLYEITYIEWGKGNNGIGIRQINDYIVNWNVGQIITECVTVNLTNNEHISYVDIFYLSVIQGIKFISNTGAEYECDNGLSNTAVVSSTNDLTEYGDRIKLTGIGVVITNNGIESINFEFNYIFSGSGIYNDYQIITPYYGNSDPQNFELFDLSYIKSIEWGISSAFGALIITKINGEPYLMGHGTIDTFCDNFEIEYREYITSIETITGPCDICANYGNYPNEFFLRGIKFHTSFGRNISCDASGIWEASYHYSYNLERLLNSPGEIQLTGFRGYKGGIIDNLSFQFKIIQPSIITSYTSYYGGNGGSILNNLNLSEIRYIDWNIDDSLNSVMLYSFTDIKTSPLGNAIGDAIGDNCLTISLINEYEHINKIRVYHGPLQKTNLNWGADKNFIRGIIFWTNKNNKYQCIASSNSQYVDEFDFSINHRNDIHVLLTGIWARAGDVIDGIKFQTTTTMYTLHPTNLPTVDPTNQPTNQPTENPTNDPSIIPTVNPTNIPSNTPTVNPTVIPTSQPTNNPSNTPTLEPSNNPTVTENPTNNPTTLPSNNPSSNPSYAPTFRPSTEPTYNPTANRTDIPTQSPSINPSNPTTIPSNNPSFNPSTNPTKNPSVNPSVDPTFNPSTNPTVIPSNNPIMDPTRNPLAINETYSPTTTPSRYPSFNPSLTPSKYPTVNPTINPTGNPSYSPSNIPSNNPSNQPSNEPSNDPTQIPNTNPSQDPTMNPTSNPTSNPSLNPTSNPTQNPTNAPTVIPTDNPTNAPFQLSSDTSDYEQIQLDLTIELNMNINSISESDIISSIVDTIQSTNNYEYGIDFSVTIDSIIDVSNRRLFNTRHLNQLTSNINIIAIINVINNVYDDIITIIESSDFENDLKNNLETNLNTSITIEALESETITNNSETKSSNGSNNTIIIVVVIVCLGIMSILIGGYYYYYKKYKTSKVQIEGEGDTKSNIELEQQINQINHKIRSESVATQSVVSEIALPMIASVGTKRNTIGEEENGETEVYQI